MSSIAGLQFHATVPHFLLTRSLGGLTGSAVYGALSGLKRTNLLLPELPGEGWVRLEVVACGICGTDLSNLAFRGPIALEPFASFPAVLGHEVLARVAEVGSGVTRVAVGDRVVVDPMISCRVRGFPEGEQCEACASGRHCTCERGGESGPLRIGQRQLSRGMSIGYHRDLPGGWSQQMLAHESQLFPVDERLDDDTAVLTEPLSIAMHAVLGARERLGDTVLVIGSGAIALSTVWALRATGYRGKLVAQTKRAHEAALAEKLGADQIARPGEEARAALLALGAKAYKPLIGPEVYAGGFATVFDCVGNARSFDQALRYTGARGQVVLLGCAAEMPKLDLTFIWADELSVRGFVGYGMEQWQGERLHTYEITHRLLLETGAPVAEMVTAKHGLSDYRRAIGSLLDRRTSNAIKVVLQPGA